jgi:integrase
MIAVQAEIPNVRIHDLRHTFARYGRGQRPQSASAQQHHQ